MNKKILSLSVIAGLFFTLSLTSCGGSEEPKEEISADSSSVDEDMEEEELDFILPSPLQTASIFKRSGLTFKSGITNPVENVTKYSSKSSKLINFGVYAADLSYGTLNKQQQEAIKYLKVVKQLSDELGMSVIFDSDNLLQSFEKNINHEDSVIYVLASIQEKLDQYLEDNQQSYLSVVIFSGAWTEGMYLGAQLAKEGKEGLFGKLMEQMIILDNIIKGLEYYEKKSEQPMEYLADFRDIKAAYENLSAIKSGEVDEKPLSEIKFVKEEVDAMIAKIEGLRTKMTN